MFIHLFHGRKDPEEDLDDWGEDGPVLGPFCNVQTTYAFHVKAYSVPDFKQVSLYWTGGLVYYDGMWYGDLEVLHELTPGRQAVEYDKEKATAPVSEKQKANADRKAIYNELTEILEKAEEIGYLENFQPEAEFEVFQRGLYDVLFKIKKNWEDIISAAENVHEQSCDAKTVSVLRIEHKHGTNVYVCKDEDVAMDCLYGYVKEWWCTEMSDVDIPNDRQTAIDKYFTKAVENEDWEIVQEEIASSANGELDDDAPVAEDT